MPANVLTQMPVSDAELVAASRGGNREAFGQIVRKYQGMVSGLIYAACGDVHRSEDLAQETFISAWKGLSGLRDPGKLAGWLCRIARHRVADQFREPAARKVKLPEDLDRREAEGAGPVEQAATAEEGELLWQTLSRIPQPYRETLVLYYRQGQSTSEVAAAMETTDEGVRQRLSRGRSMLREELARVVERGLASSAPGPDFSLAVVGALPLAAAGQAAGLAATAKGSAAAKGSGVLLLLAAWVGPLLGALSMGFITGESIYRAKAGRKRLVAAYWVVFWLYIIGWVYFNYVLVGFGRRRGWGYPVFVPVISVTWCLYCMVLYAMSTTLSGSRLIANPDPERPQALRMLWVRFAFITPLIYLGVGWLVRLSLRAGDRFSAELIVAAAVTGGAVCAVRGYKPVKMLFESWLCMMAIMLVALNCRLLEWTAAVDHSNLADVRGQVPMWIINVCAGVLLAWMVLLLLWSKRGQAKPRVGWGT